MEERNETDWEHELRSLGRIVGITDPNASAEVIGDALTSERDTLRDAIRPFSHVAERIREGASDERWLESVLFYMGDVNDPTKWSLTGHAFDRARSALLLAHTGGTENG